MLMKGDEKMNDDYGAHLQSRKHWTIHGWVVHGQELMIVVLVSI